MNDPRTLKISDFLYDLPESRIARYPLKERDESRLLFYNRGHIQDEIFKNLPELLPDDAFLVYNNSKVLPARIQFRTENGKDIEVFCLEPADGTEQTEAMSAKGHSEWNCLIGGNRKWKNGEISLRLEGKEGEISLKIKRLSMNEDSFRVAFDWDGEKSFSEILELAGKIPLPPYLRRKANQADKERYQTIYARWEGSVAAPTAGLHFTPEVMGRIRQKGIETLESTLHVGAGTFRPVATPTLEGHPMHREWVEVEFDFLQRLINEPHRPVVSVGTTSMRTLESLYWAGINLIQKRKTPPQGPGQWDPYDLDSSGLTSKDALEALAEFMTREGRQKLTFQTQILIAPPYKSKVANALITNFHQPGSTLLLLVAALIGEEWRAVYDHALLEKYRFLSYGDGSLLFF